MSAILGNIVANIQQAADTAKQAKENKEREKSGDGRRIYKVACIGHTGAGKTTFWTVLEAATRERTDGFRLQSADNPTTAYLNRQREAMESTTPVTPAPVVAGAASAYERGFPPPTDLKVDMLFSATEPGRSELLVRVLDYPGGAVAVEDAEGYSDSVIEFLKSADAVLFFMDGRETSRGKERVESQLAAFRSLRIHLEDSRGQIARPVGFVITKADSFVNQFRAANPTRIFGAADLHRRGQPFQAFLREHLKSAVYVEDPAWKERVYKTLDRVQAFVDVLLKKCSRPQLFFTSAVGEKGGTPGEFVEDPNVSVYGELSRKEFKLGSRQVGLEEPLRWLLHEVSVGEANLKASRLRNRMLGVAALWALIISLPCAGYLGCATPKMESDLAKERLVAVDVLEHARELQGNPFAWLWSRIDRRGFLPNAVEARDTVAVRVLEDGKHELPRILAEEPVDFAKLTSWGHMLRRCANALIPPRGVPLGEGGDSGGEQKVLESLGGLYDTLATVLKDDPAHRDARITSIRDAPQFALALNDSIQKALSNLLDRGFHVYLAPVESLDVHAHATLRATCKGGKRPYLFRWSKAGEQPIDDKTGNFVVRTAGDYSVTVEDEAGNRVLAKCTVVPAAPVPVAAPAGGGGGGAAAAAPATFADAYNRFIDDHRAALAKPEQRLSRAIVQGLEDLKPAQMPSDPRSRAAWRNIDAFQQAIRKYWDGQPVHFQITFMTPPGRLTLESAPGIPYGPHQDVVIPRWKLGDPVNLVFVGGDQGVPYHIDDLVGKSNTRLAVQGFPASDGGEVQFEYKIVIPLLDEATSPELPKVR